MLGRNGSLDSFHTMLRLKVLWSVSANVGIAPTIFEGAPQAAWLFQGVFVVFSGVWIYYKVSLPAPEAQSAK